MKLKTLIGIFALLIASAAQAQQATPLSNFAWEESAPDLATASGYTYLRFDDGATTGVAFTSVKCAAATAPLTGFTCVTPIPAYTPGPHVVNIRARNIAGDSPASNTLSFTMNVAPNSPTNLRLALWIRDDGSAEIIDELTLLPAGLWS